MAGHQRRRRTVNVGEHKHQHYPRRGFEESFKQFSPSRCSVGSTPLALVVDAGSQQVASDASTEPVGQLLPQSSFEYDRDGFGRRGSKVEKREGFPRRRVRRRYDCFPSWLQYHVVSFGRQHGSFPPSSSSSSNCVFTGSRIANHSHLLNINSSPTSTFSSSSPSSPSLDSSREPSLPPAQDRRPPAPSSPHPRRFPFVLPTSSKTPHPNHSPHCSVPSAHPRSSPPRRTQTSAEETSVARTRPGEGSDCVDLGRSACRRGVRRYGNDDRNS